MDNQTCSERIDPTLAHGYQICMNVVSTRLLEQSHIHFHIRIAKIAGFDQRKMSLQSSDICFSM